MLNFREPSPKPYSLPCSQTFNKPLLWNTSSAISMRSMFNSAAAFDQDMSSFSVSKVRNFAGTFFGATSFRGLGLDDWQTGAARTMNRMFANAISFVGNVSAWQTGNVTDMTLLFAFSSQFQGNISGWDVGNVQLFYGSFAQASKFNSTLPWNTSSATDMTVLFQGASSFNQSLSTWDTKRVSSMQGMFDSATSFEGVGVGSFNLSSCKDIRGAFFKAISFDEDLSGWSVGSITNFAGTFQGASSFRERG